MSLDDEKLGSRPLHPFDQEGGAYSSMAMVDERTGLLRVFANDFHFQKIEPSSLASSREWKCPSGNSITDEFIPRPP